MPEVDVVAEVARDIEVEQPVAIVVDPDRAVAVHPAMQACALADVLEMMPIEVLEEREIAVAIHEQILPPVVVEVAPHAPHRDAFTRPIQIRESRAGRDVLERAVALVA